VPTVTPYYQDDAVTIYCGDCREIVPTLGRFDLLLTDPPYGIGRDGKPRSTSSHGGHKGYPHLGWDISAPDAATFRMVLQAATDFVVWGANYYPQHMPAGPGWLFWDKAQRIDQADGELAASSRKGPLRVFTANRATIAQDGAVHPTQKPLRLFTWCLAFFPAAQTILDPCAGSGTTGRAAKDLGRKAVLIEREERYCEIAARRMAQEVLPL
jgi:site-specific DNA-methyltransferase (adenine-specific)